MKEKIAIYTDKWMIGGIEQYIINNLKIMDLEKFDIDLITTKKFTGTYDDFLKKNNINLINLGKDKMKDNEIIRLLKSVKKFIFVIKNKNYSIVHLNIYNAISMFLCFIVKKISPNTKIIVHSHNSNVGHVRLKKMKIAIHYICRYLFRNFIDYRWACSDLAAKWMFGSRSYVFMANGVNVQRFAFSKENRKKFRDSINITDDIILIGTIGRLNTQKNQVFSIRLMEEIKILGLEKKFQMIIVGDGEDKKKLESYSRKVGVDVLFISSKEDVEKVYSGMDIMIMPSLFEGLPLTLIEAQISGLYSIVSSNITDQSIFNRNLVYKENLEVFKWLNILLELSKRVDTNKRDTGDINLSEFDINVSSKKVENYYMDIVSASNHFNK